MIELLTPADMAEADRLTIAGGTPGIELMENAGRAVADAVTRRYPAGAPHVRIVAGPGNNGGDGFVAARILADRGFPVRVLLLGEQAKLKGDAAEAARRWHGPIEPTSPQALAGAGVVVDALFGAGLDRPVSGEAAAMIDAINAAGAPIIAVDLPSGIHGNSGKVQGAAIKASETVTFFRRKPGHLLLPGRIHSGLLQIADIGISTSVLNTIKPRLFVNAPPLWADHFPVPKAAGHKYSRGHAVVMSGGLASTGAARLAARGALRAGAGLVTIASPSDALAVNAAANLSIMVRQVDDAAALSALLSDRRLNAMVLGPGGGVGPALRELVSAALAAECAVVLDADALTSFAEEPKNLFSIVKSRKYQTILTPHDGEFIRLFNKHAETSLNSSKYERVRLASEASGAVVLLKGGDTVVAAPDGRASIAENAPPWLATGGSGDVLAGMVAGLLAQGMPAFEAASAAVWLHGEAANAVGPGLIAEDIPDALRGVYRQLFVDLGAWP
jgi:hydroxyethylthiazole kinase-like uncharacterized protein yjeF